VVARGDELLRVVVAAAEEAEGDLGPRHVRGRVCGNGCGRAGRPRSPWGSIHCTERGPGRRSTGVLPP
jgi:hypothetical protein